MARTKAILVVEDDRNLLEWCLELLRQAGYRASGAGSFEEGRRALDPSPDMLITDIRLGAFNGLQLVVRARNANPGLPVIVMTGYHDLVLKAETERLNAVYLCKPLPAEELLAAIEQAFAAAPQPHS